MSQCFPPRKKFRNFYAALYAELVGLIHSSALDQRIFEEFIDGVREQMAPEPAETVSTVRMVA